MFITAKDQIRPAEITVKIKTADKKNSLIKIMAIAKAFNLNIKKTDVRLSPLTRKMTIKINFEIEDYDRFFDTLELLSRYFKRMNGDITLTEKIRNT